MNMVGFVISFEITLQWAALLIDLGFTEVDIGVSATDGYVLIPVIL